MKFIVDAHLPARLKSWLIKQGYDCEHTLDLPEGNDTTPLNPKISEIQNVFPSQSVTFIGTTGKTLG